MAFLPDNLVLIGPDGNDSGCRSWAYSSPDATGAVDDAGYFNGAARLLKQGDIIYCREIDGTTLTTAFRFYVMSVIDGVVLLSATIADALS